LFLLWPVGHRVFLSALATVGALAGLFIVSNLERFSGLGKATFVASPFKATFVASPFKATFVASPFKATFVAL